MNLHEYQYLKAELAELNKLLAQTPATDVIDRMSLLARKEEVESALVIDALSVREPVRAKLTFRGKPVVGSHGIFAEFGARTVSQFVDTVATFAASLTGPLGTRGNIPNREKYQLLITGTALGSFGFELEEHRQKEHEQQNGLQLNDLSSVEQAIEKVRVLMEATLGSDDDLTDTAAEVDPRAVVALHDFLKEMADQEAVCALEFRDKVFRFSDVGEVRRSVQRLSKDNIHEEEQEVTGAFQGILPKRRIFEFRIAAGEVISGKVGPTITDAGQINQILGDKVKIQVHTTRFGDGHPRYVLLKYEKLSDQDE